MVEQIHTLRSHEEPSVLLTALAARHQDGAPVSPPMRKFSVSPLILTSCLHSANLSFLCATPIHLHSRLGGMNILKWSAPLLLTCSTPSVFSPCPGSSITVQRLLPPSASFLFCTPELSHPHPPCSPIGCSLFKFRHNKQRLFMEANFSTQIPFSGSLASHPPPPSYSSSSFFSRAP